MFKMETGSEIGKSDASSNIKNNEDHRESFDKKETVKYMLESNNTKPSILLQLPQELWSMILENVPQEDRVQQRLVNKQWCTRIDECSTFKIEYNSIPSSLLSFVLSLRIRSCVFSGSGGDIQSFKHPLLMREITLSSNVSAENAKKVLCECSNIESLRCFVTKDSDTSFKGNENDLKYLNVLKKLRAIEIGILYFSRRSPTSRSTTFGALIGNRTIVFPVLSHVIIHYSLTPREWVELLYFVKRHSKTIQGLHLSHCICGAINSVEGESPDPEIPNLESLSDCQLSSIVFTKISSCRCNGEQLWSKMLYLQCKVKKLWTSIIPSTSVINEFIQNNEKTLESLILEDIPLGVNTTMDGSIFQNCVLLQELQLHFLSCSVIVIRVSDHPDAGSEITKRYAEFVGLQFLPKSLRKLAIAGCDISTTTLIEMSSTLTKLQDLQLEDPGSPTRYDYGVTIEVLLSFFRNFKNLRKLKVHDNFTNKSSETESKWKKVNTFFIQNGLTVNNIDNTGDGPVKSKTLMGCVIELEDCSIDVNLSAFCGSRSKFLEMLDGELM